MTGPPETWEIPSELQDTLYHCEDDQTRGQVAQRGGTVSILGNTQKSFGHGPGQPAIDDPV